MDSFVATKKRVPTKLNTPLAHSFGFDYGDLQNNRSGFISHWQKKRLRWYLLSYSVSILVWIFLLTVFPLAFFTGNDVLSSLAKFWVAGVLVVFGLIWVSRIRSVFLDGQGGKVAELISEVRHVRHASKKRQRIGMEVYEHHDMDYFITIGSERFICSKEQMEAFHEGVLYHIYIAPESRQILSAEPLTQGEIDESAAFLSEKDKHKEIIHLQDDETDTIAKRKN